MADQNRNQQTNQNTSRDQNQQQGPQRTGQKEGDSERERSTREPASTAHDRDIGLERHDLRDTDRNLGSDIEESEPVESDLDDEDRGR